MYKRQLLAQFTKVILNLIILGIFIPERMWGAGGMPSAHSATVCALLVATGRYCGTGSTEFALALVLAIIVMYDAKMCIRDRISTPSTNSGISRQANSRWVPNRVR